MPVAGGRGGGGGGERERERELSTEGSRMLNMRQQSGNPVKGHGAGHISINHMWLQRPLN